MYILKRKIISHDERVQLRITCDAKETKECT